MKLFAILLTILFGSVLANDSTDDFLDMKVLCLGCSSGIGRATAEILLRGGAEVVVSSRTQDKCNDVVRPFEHGYAIAADAGDLDGLEDLVEKSRKALGGRISHLAFCATSLSSPSLAADSKAIIGAMNDQMNINVYSLLTLYKLLKEDLVASKGSIVSVSSIAAVTPQLGSTGYGIAKIAQERLIKDIAADGARLGIRANAVAPGAIDTPIFDAFGDARDAMVDNMGWRHALNRIGKPEEVGHMMSFLLSEKGGFATGQTFTIDGGAALWSSFVDFYANIKPEVDQIYAKAEESEH